MKKVIIFLSPTRCWLDVAYGHEIHNYILIRVACCDNTTLQSGITHNTTTWTNTRQSQPLQSICKTHVYPQLRCYFTCFVGQIKFEIRIKFVWVRKSLLFLFYFTKNIVVQICCFWSIVKRFKMRGRIFSAEKFKYVYPAFCDLYYLGKKTSKP